MMADEINMDRWYGFWTAATGFRPNLINWRGSQMAVSSKEFFSLLGNIGLLEILEILQYKAFRRYLKQGNSID